ALSRSRLVIQILLETKQKVERGGLCALDVVQAPEPQGGRDEEEMLQLLRGQLLEGLQEIDRLQRKAQQTQQKLISTSRNMKPKQHRKLRFAYARLMVDISRQIRAIPFSSRFQCSLSNALRKIVDQVKPLEHEIARLQ